jgi:DNA polymerase-3 subunit gamma/tau
MSYEVLARKWRPLRFDDVVGQDHVTGPLKKAVETGRVSHAYLFAGPRGCGKTSTARILARAVNCDSLEGGNPCNACPSCRGVIAGNNLDVMEIDGASHTGVNEVRDLQESIGYAPSHFRNKVYVIDEVHMLSTHAFNALLKTLEEPPPHVYFIFATTAPNKIPETIKSRCQRHHFKRLEIREIAAQLEAICKAEGVACEEEGLRLLSRKAEGSMRDGTSLLDQCITASGARVTAAAVRGILGLVDQEKVLAFIEAVATGDATRVLELVDQAVTEGLDLQELSAALLEGYRDLMVLATRGDLDRLIFRSKDEIALLRAQLERYELADLVTVVERLCNTAPRLKGAADPRVLLESLLVDLSLLERQTDIRTLITRLEGASGSGVSGEDAGASRRGRQDLSVREKAAAAAPKDTTAPAHAAGASAASASTKTVRAAGDDLGANPAHAKREAAAPVESGTEVASGDPLDFDRLQELWGGFVTFVRQKRVSLGVSLFSGKPYAFDGRRLTLRFMRNFTLQREQVSEAANRRFVESSFRRYFGHEVEIVCIAEGEERAAAMEERKRERTTPEARVRGVSEEKKPIVRKLLQEFDGEIIRYGQ